MDRTGVCEWCGESTDKLIPGVNGGTTYKLCPKCYKTLKKRVCRVCKGPMGSMSFKGMCLQCIQVTEAGLKVEEEEEKAGVDLASHRAVTGDSFKMSEKDFTDWMTLTPEKMLANMKKKGDN